MSDVNLIPTARIEKRRRKTRMRLWTAICGTYVILLAGLALSAHAFWRDTDDSVIEELAFTEQRIKGYNATISEFQQKLAKAQADLEAGKVISSQPDWTKLLVLVGDELREEVVLGDCQLATLNRSRENVTNNLQDSFSSSPPSVYLAERQYKLELSGFGRTQTSVSQFVLRLERMQMFDKVELVNSRRKAFLSGKAVAFSIECSI
jgi:Tfp pilus assembly protein PilN